MEGPTTEAEASRRLALEMALAVAGAAAVHLVAGAWAQLGKRPRHPEAAETPDLDAVAAVAAVAGACHGACKCRDRDDPHEQSGPARLDVLLPPHVLHHLKVWVELQA